LSSWREITFFSLLFEFAQCPHVLHSNTSPFPFFINNTQHAIFEKHVNSSTVATPIIKKKYVHVNNFDRGVFRILAINIIREGCVSVPIFALKDLSPGLSYRMDPFPFTGVSYFLYHQIQHNKLEKYHHFSVQGLNSPWNF